MGMCFSKKKKQQQHQPLSPPPLDKREEEKKVVVDEGQLVTTTTTTKETRTATRTIARRADAEKKPVFVIAAAAHKLKSTPSASAAASNSSKEEEEERKAAVGVVENRGDSSNNEKPAIMVRTSSCSKEEVDAILIQCGRLSRSSSNKASPKDAGGERRRYSGSKRSYDFDNDRSTGEHREDEDGEKLPLPRPSPRRRTPSRERAAGSGGGGSRRVSRSPGRRIPDSDKPRQQQQQPGKMVSVPAREKVGGSARRVGAAAATSRSNSPAKNARMVTSENAAVHQPQSLSRSNSKKAEQSPFRRNPMAEIDDNSVMPPSQRAQKIGRDGEEAIRKPGPVHNQRSSDRRSGGGGGSGGGSMCVREQLMSCRPKEKLLVQPVPPETGTDLQENQNNPRAVVTTRSSRSSRRSSKDFDANPASYASLMLEDIQNYHQQSGGFSLPACLSKACSILEAVADLNSSSSGDNVRLGRGTFVPRGPMVESEIGVEDDLTEPSLHKYVSEMEPQESAGSNSFVGGQHWERNSVGSTDRHWVHVDDGEEMEEEVVVRGKRLSGGGAGVSASSNSLPRQLLRSGGGGGGREDCSLPVEAAASATS